MSKDKEANDREEYRKLRDGIPPGMVYAFHRALSDGDLGEEGFDEIRTGLTAAFAHLLSSAPAPGKAVWSLGDIEDGTWRDLDHVDHGGFAKVVWRMEGDERSPENEARALAMVAALNAAEVCQAPCKSLRDPVGNAAQQATVSAHGTTEEAVQPSNWLSTTQPPNRG